MQVSIDARYIRERQSGIGAYVQELVDRLPVAAPEDHFHFWVHPRAKQPLSPASNVSETLVHAPANGLSTLLRPSQLAPLENVDVLHAPFNILGRGIGCTRVTTIHDLMWVLTPHYCEPMSVTRPFSSAFFRNGILRALRESTRIHAISQATADVIATHFPDAVSRVRVIPHGIDARYRPPDNREQVRTEVKERIGLKEEDRYFLVVGQNAPYKNHANILRAFAGAELGPNVKLVLLQRLRQRGRFGLSKTSALFPLSVRLGIQEQVVWLSQISDSEILKLLQGAAALIQYSLCEGFGMPALEAAACGTPVVASDIPPLVEVLGSAGLCVPLDPPALSKALQRVAGEEAYRQELSEAGIRRSQDFCWDRCAEAHLELYREAAEDGPLG